jgi:predicted aspartyl protease
MSTPHPRTTRRLVWRGWPCAMVLWAAVMPAAMADCRIGIIGELSVDTAHNRLLTDGSLNGQPVKVLVDTGSYFSFVWESAARRLGLPLTQLPPDAPPRVFGVGGEEKVLATVIKRWQVGTFYANGLELAVIGDAPRKAEPHADVVLGAELFLHFTTEFDVANGKIRLLRTDGCTLEQLPYWAKTYSVAQLESWTDSLPRIRTRVTVNGRTLMAQLDTGAPTSGIARSAAETAGVTPWTQEAAAVRKIHGPNGREEDAWVGTFEALSIGDESIKNARLFIADMFGADRTIVTGSHVAWEVGDPPLMLVGCDFFRAHRVIVTGKEHKLEFTYNGGPIFQVMSPAGDAATH